MALMGSGQEMFSANRANLALKNKIKDRYQNEKMAMYTSVNDIQTIKTKKLTEEEKLAIKNKYKKERQKRRVKELILAVIIVSIFGTLIFIYFGEFLGAGKFFFIR